MNREIESEYSHMQIRSAMWTGVIVAALAGVGIIALGVLYFKEYGLAVFLLAPFIIGAVAPIVAGLIAPISRATSIRAGMLALLLVGVLLISTAIEGVICIVMAAPLAGGIGFLGSTFGDYIQQSHRNNRVSVIFALVFILPPSLLTVEHKMEPNYQIHSVTTSIAIAASADVVWKNVIAFPQLAPPTEFLFKTGIAYPIRARIEGEGAGAIRYCDFSTGSFVEPITVWEENRRLGFSVREHPIPMKELSPYEDIEPAHLHGYFVSTKGEFRLIDLGNGWIRLEGTTWYYQKLHPGFYWNLWADEIIHTIHGRVLKHIKQEAERKSHVPR